jgi:hypothetical protein
MITGSPFGAISGWPRTLGESDKRIFCPTAPRITATHDMRVPFRLGLSHGRVPCDTRLSQSRIRSAGVSPLTTNFSGPKPRDLAGSGHFCDLLTEGLLFRDFELVASERDLSPTVKPQFFENIVYVIFYRGRSKAEGPSNLLICETPRYKGNNLFFPTC